MSAIELADRWRNLADAARKPWDDKAAAAQEAYLQECTSKCLEDGGGGDDNEEDEEANDGGEEGGEEGDGDDDDIRTTNRSCLPLSRVKRIAQDHLDVNGCHLGKEATFTASKVRSLASLPRSLASPPPSSHLYLAPFHHPRLLSTLAPPPSPL